MWIESILSDSALQTCVLCGLIAGCVNGVREVSQQHWLVAAGVIFLILNNLLF